MIRQAASYSTISGGSHNAIDSGALYNAIGGGQNNLIAPTISDATIPGGVNLIANANAQTVMGSFNKPDSSSILIVGNGTGVRSNAFTVSDSGYTTAYQNLPSGDSTVFGSTYADNTIIAWGDYNAPALGSCGTGGSLLSGIGDTVKLVPGSPGHYQIYLKVKNLDGSTHQFTSSGSAIVVTPKPAGLNVPIMTASDLNVSGSTAYFDVWTYQLSGGSATANCGIGFQFHVVAH